MNSQKDEASMLTRALSYLIAVISIISAVAGLVAFSLDYGDWIEKKMQEVISGISLPIAPPSVEQKTDEPVDCSAIPEMTNRIFCINKQKERDECAQSNCRSPVKGQAARHWVCLKTSAATIAFDCA